MSNKSDLERLSKDTWERIRDARDLGIQFGEETITNLVLLDLKRIGSRRMKFLQTPKFQEQQSGTDFEWWVGKPGRWLRLAIQAKRINTMTRRYDHLNHKVKGQQQIGLLREYALSNRAIPMYCFYNYRKQPTPHVCWHCCKPPEEEQLGITLVKLSVVEKAIKIFGNRTFDEIHKNKSTRPWRCLAQCPEWVSAFSGSTQSEVVDESFIDFLGEEPYFYQTLPEAVEEARDTGRVQRFDTAQYAQDRGYPKKILIYDLAKDDDTNT